MLHCGMTRFGNYKLSVFRQHQNFKKEKKSRRIVLRDVQDSKNFS